MFEKQFTGIYDKNGKPINEGDKLKFITDGHTFEDTNYIVTCRYDEKSAAFGVEAKYLGAERFFAFCHICNVEYEVINKA